MSSVSFRAIAWIRKSGIVIAVLGLLQIFGAQRATADTLKTFTVATSGWAQLFQMCSPCPADPFTIDATSTITIDTSTGKLVASHVTASGTSPFSGTVPFSFQSQQSGSGYTLLTFSGAAAYSIQGNGTFTIQLNIYVPVASLVGYSGGALCSPTNPCAAGATVEVIQCVGSNCTGSGAYTGTYTANAGQITATTVTNSPNAVPLIYPLVPSATAPGGPAFTLTVSGTGFVSGAVVNWNGVALTTTFVNGSQVTAAVPAANIATAGTAVITVTNPGPGGGTSNREDFQVTNALTATNFTVFSNNEIDVYKNRTSNTLAGDFNGDGKLDVVAYANGFIYFLPGNGDGTFGNWAASVGPPPSTNSSDFNTYLATADLNGDGIPDLVLMNYNGTFAAIGNGNGTFRLASTSLSNFISLGYVVIADFNGDGFLDLAYATNSSTGTPGVQVLLGNGDGTFRTGPFTSFTSSSTPELYAALATGDFNGDGKLDLVAVAVGGLQMGGNTQLFVFPGNGDGSFATPSPVPGTSMAGLGLQGFPPISALVGDFNGDGKLDLAYFILQYGGAFGGNTGDLTVSLGNGDGTFRVPFHALGQPNGVIGPLLAGDFNGDGKLDLVAGNQLFYGNGDGTLTAYGPAVSGLQVIQVGDFNGDGKVDLLALGASPSNSSQVDLRLLTQIPAPPDFEGGITPLTQTVVPGGSVNYAGQVTALNGFTGNVALSTSGMPTGVTASFNPATVTGGSGSYTMAVSVASSVAVGTYSITVAGTSGSLVHSSTVTLIVNSSPGDFSGSVASNSEAYQNIFAGQNATYVFQITPSGGFTGDVTLSVSGLPSGTTASFNPSTIHGGSGTSTLTVFTTSATPESCNPVTPTLGSCALVITATSGPLTHSGDVLLGIRTSHGDFTGTITPSSQTIGVGQTATYVANVSYLNGYSPSNFCLFLSVTGLPPGAQLGRISQTGCYPTTGESDTITISAPPGTTPGTYTLLVTGFGAGRVRAGAATLTIQ